ncbi:cytochrome c biogenesis protein [Candidatus Methanoperedens nitroreducens]|uniref:Cytochrome c biogenesis protein n=1 Tax=Candidatus Methanoperedens nitratireducens TaxID=1392998 RepID=A0A062V5R7_9EURY|nr:cytochrome c biogenesis protein CcdA [Candidatus Methanoperedens nitroreducens]KCZ70755.1 cytochrome c biogenesis protein [Candidatus Methanoperedens nitroreducens]MDJ1420612.1 cytochrome c biogenesis protein CcdA [Candidatus Methanoperedens sp.]
MAIDPQTLTLPLVITAGLIDGFNPCAFAVLLLFITFTMGMLQMQTNYRFGLWRTGLIYISGIFITYVLIGVGFLGAISFFSTTHAVGKAAAFVSMILGVVVMKDYFIPGGFGLSIPKRMHTPINNWIKRTSAPGVFGAGVLVGLCTVPCSGGIYLAVLGLLALQSTLAQGILYLLLYNLMLIMPLVAVLLASSNRVVVDKMVAWQSRNSTRVKLVMGSFMIAMGFVILVII